MIFPYDTRIPSARYHRPIILFTMGKVGGTSIVDLTRKKFKNVFCYHEYKPNDSRDMSSGKIATPGDIKLREERNALVDNYLNSDIVTKDNPAIVFSLIREPGIRIISSLFFSIQINLPIKHHPLLKDKTLGSYQDILVNHYDWMWHTKWFDEQLKPCYKIDVFDYEFPKEKGWQVIEENNIKLILIRTEDLSRVWDDVNSKIFGGNLPRMTVSNRTRNSDYNKYKELIKFPSDMISSLYDNKQVRHFYTDEEIDLFKSKRKYHNE